MRSIVVVVLAARSTDAYGLGGETLSDTCDAELCETIPYETFGDSPAIIHICVL